MSERLYYSDSYTTHFSAKVIEQLSLNDIPAIVLDGTYFYPESGGQPSDRGMIGGVPVLAVTIRESDDAILHWLGQAIGEGDVVAAEIDWDRRFDHMQHHSGQHVLSQAFVQAAGAETESFHLSDETSTIDLHTTEVSQDQVEQAELVANQVIWENRPVRSRLVAPGQAAEMPMRKRPPSRNGKLRLIDIEDFDLTACGGTHVSRTGEIRGNRHHQNHQSGKTRRAVAGGISLRPASLARFSEEE
jgi:alanyl-tRNA synthetase